jgi:hypothetical protein
VSYIPTDAMIAQGGYEVDAAPWIYLQPGPFAYGVEGIIWHALDRLMRSPSS